MDARVLGRRRGEPMRTAVHAGYTPISASRLSSAIDDVPADGSPHAQNESARWVGRIPPRSQVAQRRTRAGCMAQKTVRGSGLQLWLPTLRHSRHWLGLDTVRPAWPLYTRRLPPQLQPPAATGSRSGPASFREPSESIMS